MSQHPGKHIKNNVLPAGVTVKKAAELLAVGRPALSNLLNGNAALTSEMAFRIQKAFGANAQQLLAMQAAYDESEGREQAKELAVRTYVPNFLGITARQISAWSDQTNARSELPALLRRLVRSTGEGLTKVDFPAYDNAQRPGWDGFVSADVATPWIPRGESGWEFGCSQNPERKADDDFEARTSTVPDEERKNLTFVFVTPRNWPGKEPWAKKTRALGAWKDVRALDASDLEQWLETSIPTQTWFDELIGSAVSGAISPEAHWNDWANAATPPLSKLLFRAPIAATKDTLAQWLSAPPTRPYIVAADSEGEGLAFVACALEQLGDPPGKFSDRALILRTPEALKRTTALAPDFIAIVASSDVEAAGAAIQTTHHLLIVRRRNEIANEPNIMLDLVDDQTFRDALTDMKLNDIEFQRYSRETANSPTILRRLFSDVPAVRNPAWSTDKALARKLIPLSFAGIWDSDSEADREVMKTLAGAEYPAIEQIVTELCLVADAPMWSIGKYRGVMSKIDVLFSTHALITQKDLDDFLLMAELVLSEDNPALDLPPDKQWMANIYNKVRQHSAGLRKGLCETLVLFAAHGDTLLGKRLGIDVQGRVNKLIRNLLTPLDARRWSAQRDDLPRYAEAAPEVFLEILEQDLKTPAPKIFTLLQPADTGVFGSCPRTGLLWALETIAWKPERLLPVSRVLAKLAEIHISDNWSNKPEATLESIYRAWMPQTAASIDQRNNAMEEICRRTRGVGWRLIVSLFGSHHQIGHYNVRPHWRNEAAGAGQTVKTYNEIWRVADKARGLALAWPSHDEKTLGDLVARLGDMPDVDQDKVWSLVTTWAKSDADDNARHVLRERIRTMAFTRRARIRKVTAAVKDKARDAYALLAPRDLIIGHLWLFEKIWVEESAEETEEEDLQYEKREARIAALRKAALTEIWKALGYDGIMRLSGYGEAASSIGWTLVDVLDRAEWVSFIDRLTAQGEPPDTHKVDEIISRFLSRLDPESRNALIADRLGSYTLHNGIERAIRLLKCAPFRAETWAHLDALSEAWRSRYWREAYAGWDRHSEDEINILIDNLLEAQRPRAAFRTVHIDFDKVETQRLARLLRSVATIDAEPAGRFELQEYEVSEAFKSLRKRPDIGESELAQLEFMYVSALEHSDYGIPTLQRALAEQPALFMQLVGLAFKRRDPGEDPVEWKSADDARAKSAASAAYSILHRYSRLPGTGNDGSVDVMKLRTWIDDVRSLGAHYARAEICDHVIGEMLGRCPSDPDGTWPCEPVCQVLDAIASNQMASSVATGRYNMRGAHFHGPNGDDERGLAKQYRTWASKVAFKYPFTAKLLDEIARGYDREALWHDNWAGVRKRVDY